MGNYILTKSARVCSRLYDQARQTLVHWSESVVDWWLTKRTGKSKQQREWDKWTHENIAFRSNTVHGTFYLFKHVIEVDSGKLFNPHEPFGWVTVEQFKRRYEYPHRALGDNAVWMWFRCERNRWTGELEINELCGADRLFVATNNDRDAIMIALQYS